MEQNNIPADAQERIEKDGKAYMHSEIKGMVGDDEISTDSLSRAYIKGATAEAKRAQENKRLLDEAQTLLSKEREKGWKLFNALEWIKTYGPVDDLTIKFIDKALQQWKDRKEPKLKGGMPELSKPILTEEDLKQWEEGKEVTDEKRVEKNP